MFLEETKESNRKETTKCLSNNQENIQNEDIKYIDKKEMVSKNPEFKIETEEINDNQIQQNDEYETPPIELLERSQKSNITIKDLANTAQLLQKGLYNLGISAKIQNVSVGPMFTIYEINLFPGVRYNTIKKLKDDIAFILSAELLDITKIPSRQAVGIVVKNKQKQIVRLRDLIDSEEFEKNDSNLLIGIGKEIDGATKLLDIKESSHILISGTTGSGKSCLINSIICCLMYKSSPHDVKFLLIDTKIGAELNYYNGVPHMLIPAISDVDEVAGALAWVVHEMQNRENIIISSGCKDIYEYNSQNNKLPDIILIIDEYAELNKSRYKKDIDDYVCKITKYGERLGIYAIIAISKAQISVIPGIIKFNFATRIAFHAADAIDSNLTLDQLDAKEVWFLMMKLIEL